MLQFAANIILARLLRAAWIGVFAVAMAVIGVFQVLREFGIDRSLIQESELTEVKLRTVSALAIIVAREPLAAF